MIADDDPASRLALTAVLERAGFGCRSCGSADEAVALLAQPGFDLIIADIHMPGNDGLELVASLGAREDMPPVILVTGQPSIETASRAVRLRAIDYLLKPVEAPRLLQAVKEGVATSRMQRQLRAHRARMKESLGEMNRCEELLRSGSAATANAALGTYVSLAVQDALATISDLGELAEVLVGQDEGGQSERRLHGARPLGLVGAVRDTIQILEKTKTSFKSKELADLRKRLEALIGPTPP